MSTALFVFYSPLYISYNVHILQLHLVVKLHWGEKEGERKGGGGEGERERERERGGRSSDLDTYGNWSLSVSWVY